MRRYARPNMTLSILTWRLRQRVPQRRVRSLHFIVLLPAVATSACLQVMQAPTLTDQAIAEIQYGKKNFPAQPASLSTKACDSATTDTAVSLTEEEREAIAPFLKPPGSGA